MTLCFFDDLLAQIHAHAEDIYPEEGAGFLLGADGNERTVHALSRFSNAREDTAQRNRFLIKPEDYLKAEL